MFCHQGFDFQSDQLIQSHLQNRSCLSLGKAEFFCCFLTGFRLEADTFGHTVYQTLFYLFLVFTSTQDLDDQIDHITGFDQTLLDLFLFQFFI